MHNRRTFLRGWMATLCTRVHAVQRNRVQLVRELSGKRGVFDISHEGTLLAVHRNLGSSVCEAYVGCRETFHELQVLRAETHSRVRSVKMSFGSQTEFSRWVFAFVPGTNDLILGGRLLDHHGRTAFWLWNANTGSVQPLAQPESRFEFVACIDDKRVLGTAPDSRGREKRVVLALGTGTVTEVPSISDVNQDEPLLTALIKTRGGPEYLLRQLRIEVTGTIHNAVLLSGGELAVLSGAGQGPIDVDPERNPAFLGVYDLRSRKRLRDTQLFTEEQLVDRTALFGGKAYTDGLIGHFGFQIACNPERRLLAFSYEKYQALNRLLPGLRVREPRFAVYDTDSLAGLGTVSHPKETITDDGWASVSPSAGGKLLFSRDGR